MLPLLLQFAMIFPSLHLSSYTQCCVSFSSTDVTVPLPCCHCIPAAMFLVVSQPSFYWLLILIEYPSSTSLPCHQVELRRTTAMCKQCSQCSCTITMVTWHHTHSAIDGVSYRQAVQLLQWHIPTKKLHNTKGHNIHATVQKNKYPYVQ